MDYGQMGTDRIATINYERMREYRLNRTKQVMEKYNIGMLVTYEPWNVRYVCGGYITIPTRWTEGHLAIVPRNADPYLYAPYYKDVDMPWLAGRIMMPPGSMKDCFTVEDCMPTAKEIYRIAKENGLENEQIGIDGTQSQIILFEALKSLGLKPVDSRRAMFEARKIKSQDEIACHRMAIACAEAAFEDIKDAIRPGVKECELVGIGMNKLYALGCDETMEFVCSSGPRTNLLHADFTDRMVRPGDLVIIDINGASYQGYKSCYYRTFCCGKATQKQKDAFKICKDMMYAGMEGIKAGNTTEDICKHFPSDPHLWGFDDLKYVSGYAMGHGIGLSLHEEPFFSGAPYHMGKMKPMVLEEGMVIAIETWYGEPGGYDGVRLEEDIAVTKDGYELLTRYPVDGLIECGV